ncbi:unnamed protein product, partial [marine sediment metagenome]
DLRLDPQICLDPDDYVHLFWWDQRDGTGQEEIYYKTNRIQLEVEEVKLELTNSMELMAYPNPFKQMTEIRYQITDSGLQMANSGIQIKIYDVTGRLVKYFSLPLSGISYPISVITWDGLDELGNDCPPGVYILDVQAKGISKSLILIHIE